MLLLLAETHGSLRWMVILHARKERLMNVKGFTVTVETKMTRTVLLFKPDNDDWQEYFKKLGECALDKELKKNYDECRALVKWAETARGTILEVKSEKRVVDFTIRFDRIEDLEDFTSNFYICVERDIE